MAEALALASSVVSIAGFAGQLAQSSNFLYGFFSNIRDAPEDVRKLLEELGILESIFGSIQKSFTGHDSELKQALNYCEQRISELMELVKAIEPTKSLNKGQRLWKQLKVALKSSEVAKHLGNLERAKSMLMQACINSTRNVHTRNSEMLQVIENSLSSLSLAHETFLTTITNSQRIAEQIEDTSASLTSSSARIAQITTEAYSMVDRLTNDTLQIQSATEKIESVARKLVDTALNKRPKLHRALEGEVERIISNNLLNHLQDKMHYGTKSSPHYTNNQENSILQHSGRSQIELGGKWQTSKQIDVPRITSDHTASRWVKESAVESRKELIRNTLFGTIVMSTATASYSRQSPEDPEESPAERKDVSQTTVMFLPATWLLSKGAVLRIKTMRLLGRAKCRQNPHLSISTVNILPEESEIFQACQRRDLVAIRTLFDEGHASPYDVDKIGRNLLGYVSFGARVCYPSFRDIGLYEVQFTETELQEAPMFHLANLFAVTNFLIEQGVDAGSLDLYQWNPVMMFTTIWFESDAAISEYEDHFQHLLNTLLTNTKSDPFGCCDAFVDVQKDGEYKLWSFPGVDNTAGQEISCTALELLIRQEKWPLSWDPNLLWNLSSARALYLPNTIESVRDHVSFWVTSSAADVKRYLDAKLDLLIKLIRHNRILYSKCHCEAKGCIHEAIHQGAEVIALLSEHTYTSNACGNELPWLRHRLKKLVLVEAYMLKVIKLHLAYGFRQLASSSILNDISRHAAKHNARTFCVWKKALSDAVRDMRRSGHSSNIFETYIHDNADNEHEGRNCKEHVGESSILRSHEDNPDKDQGKSSEQEIEEDDNIISETSGMDTSDQIMEQESASNNEEEWETEVSEYTESAWETEEEWEEGYMLETAVDLVPLDDVNQQMSDSQRHTCSKELHDYDEGYWSHIYCRIMNSTMDSTSTERQEGKLGTIARIAGTFICSIV